MMGTKQPKGVVPSVDTFLRSANEYYNMQETFDELYEKSQKEELKGVDLLSKILNRNNIKLAYGKDINALTRKWTNSSVYRQHLRPTQLFTTETW